MRRLALGADYVAGEAFASYVDRLADSCATTRAEVWVATGIGANGAPPPGYGVTMSAQHAASFAQATGLTPRQVHSLLLEWYAATAVDTAQLDSTHPEKVRSWQRLTWVSIWGSSLCPACLAENGGLWMRAWKLSWTVLCPVHHCYLLHACPDCGTRFHSNTRDRRQRYRCAGRPPLDPEERGLTTKGTLRARRARGDACDNDLTTLLAPAVSDPFVLQLAAWLHAAVEPDVRDSLEACDASPSGATPRDPTEPPQDSHFAQQFDASWTTTVDTSSPRLELFRTLRACVQLVLYLGTAELLAGRDPLLQDRFRRFVADRDDASVPRRADGRRETNRSNMRAPDDPLLMAAALTVAVPLLVARGDELNRLCETFVDARPTNRQSRNEWWHVQKFFSPPEHLREPLRRARDRNSFGSLGALDGRARKRAGNTGATPDPAAWVPSLCWPEAYRHFAPLFPPRGYPVTGPRMVAVALVMQLASGAVDYTAATAAVGLPAGIVSTFHRQKMRWRKTGDDDRFVALTASLARAITEHPPPLSYSQRRHRVAAFTDIGERQWAWFCRQRGWRVDEWATERRSWVTTWVWTRLTGGDWHLAPALGLARLEPNRRGVASNGYQQWLTRHEQSCLDTLLSTTATIKSRYGIPGPPTWTPTWEPDLPTPALGLSHLERTTASAADASGDTGHVDGRHDRPRSPGDRDDATLAPTMGTSLTATDPTVAPASLGPIAPARQSPRPTNLCTWPGPQSPDRLGHELTPDSHARPERRARPAGQPSSRHALPPAPPAPPVPPAHPDQQPPRSAHDVASARALTRSPSTWVW